MNVRLHRAFRSEWLNNARTVSVWVPPDYNESRRRYPVFYLHDGQNLFDPATAFGGVPWGADRTAERLILGQRIKPIILVGIANTRQRLNEYGPTGRRARGPSRAHRYGRFIVEEVKPFIDRLYRTLPERHQTAIGGSSMGGLISLFLAQWHPETFGMCMAMSPSLWWDRELILRQWPADPQWLRGLRLWIDMGTEEGETAGSRRMQVRRARQLAALLESAGRKSGVDYEFRYLEAVGGRHNERDWGERFGSALEFFFGQAGSQKPAAERRGWDSNP